MRQKLKPDFDPEEVQADLIDAVCAAYDSGISIRAVAKDLNLSPMKVRKILITAKNYSTDLSKEIYYLYKDGRTPAEIAEIMNMTVANVNSYLPYERIIYNMEERSVEADRQARYRERKKKGIEQPKKEIPKIERVRDKRMLFIIGKKLRRYIPDQAFDRTSDPLARYWSSWGTNGVVNEPPDPDSSIWCAEATISGKGKNRKIGVVLMSANSGFVVMSPLPEAPKIEKPDPNLPFGEQLELEEENREKADKYAQLLEKTFIDAIRKGMLDFGLPEERVLDYTDTVASAELIKAKPSTPSGRLEEFIERSFEWEQGDDPVAQFNVRCNWGTRKFGNSTFYRHVDAAVQEMLGMTYEESRTWLTDFIQPDVELLRARKNEEV